MFKNIWEENTSRIETDSISSAIKTDNIGIVMSIILSYFDGRSLLGFYVNRIETIEFVFCVIVKVFP
jgi:hypothetical protein